METFEQVLMKACKEEVVNLSFMRVCIFMLNFTNMFLFTFRYKKRCYMPDDCSRTKVRFA